MLTIYYLRSLLKTGTKTDHQQEQDHIPQHAAVCVSAGMCVGEKAEKTKQKQREKNEGDHRKWPNASHSQRQHPPLQAFCPDISAPLLTNAALCRAAALMVALGHPSQVCFTLSFLRLRLKFGREHQNSVLDTHSFCGFFQNYEAFFDAREDNAVYAFLGLTAPPGSKVYTHTHTHVHRTTRA